MELQFINKLATGLMLCLSRMRTFYILTLLFTFQPASWAAVNVGAIVPIEFEHSTMASPVDAKGDTQSNVSSAHLTASEHRCIQAINSSADDTADCLNTCLDYCNSIAGLALSVPELPKVRVYISYPPAAAYAFLSLIGSPETHPPKLA